MSDCKHQFSPLVVFTGHSLERHRSVYLWAHSVNGHSSSLLISDVSKIYEWIGGVRIYAPR